MNPEGSEEGLLEKVPHVDTLSGNWSLNIPSDGLKLTSSTQKYQTQGLDKSN